MRGRRSWIVASAVMVGCVGVVAQGPGGGGFGPGGPGSGGRGPGGFGPGGFGPGRGFGRGVVVGQPFTDGSTSTSTEKLADGVTITHSSTSTEARDAQGRTLHTVTGTAGGAAGSAAKTFTRTTLMDPVAHTVTSWGSENKTAVVMHLPDAPGGRGGRGERGPGGPGAGGPTGAATPGDGPGPGGKGGRLHPQVTREVLAGKTIAGVYATGVKTTMTIPAGAEGNDKALVSVREVWTSPDLKIAVLETSDDPRNGSHKMEVTSLSTGAPDSTLFQVPSGYTVKEETRHHGE